MDAAQTFVFISSYYIFSKLLTILLQINDAY